MFGDVSPNLPTTLGSAAYMVIKKQLIKSIDENSLNFNELKIRFYSNIKQLKSLDIHDPLYSKLYYESEDIIKAVENLTIG